MRSACYCGELSVAENDDVVTTCEWKEVNFKDPEPSLQFQTAWLRPLSCFLLSHSPWHFMFAVREHEVIPPASPVLYDLWSKSTTPCFPPVSVAAELPFLHISTVMSATHTPNSTGPGPEDRGRAYRSHGPGGICTISRKKG
jgi:hypothetical protein